MNQVKYHETHVCVGFDGIVDQEVAVLYTGELSNCLRAEKAEHWEMWWGKKKKKKRKKKNDVIFKGTFPKINTGAVDSSLQQSRNDDLQIPNECLFLL